MDAILFCGMSVCIPVIYSTSLASAVSSNFGSSRLTLRNFPIMIASIPLSSVWYLYIVRTRRTFFISPIARHVDYECTWVEVAIARCVLLFVQLIECPNTWE
jgi:hypothetical protein